ncbi:MAG: SpoIIIAH-like family protein [Clostridia bacterium]|nr:SpoIIIAH-like family protein [Clostridia bacterium]
MSKKKKVIILTVMIALLLVTGFINVALNNNLAVTTSNTTSNESFYTVYRTKRETTRIQEIQFYESILTSVTATSEAKQDAEASKYKLIQQMESELVVEGIIRGKGFTDAVIAISDTNINVFVKAATLEKSEVAQITKVVTEQLGVEIDKVIITPSE